MKLLERSISGNPHHIFLDFIKINNEENSKGINGQVATADEKAFVGSAEVQERILNDYTESRLRSLMYFHNEITLPFLIAYNDGNTAYRALQGMKWMPVDFMKDEGRSEGRSANKAEGRQPNKTEEEKKEDVKNTYKNPFG